MTLEYALSMSNRLVPSTDLFCSNKIENPHVLIKPYSNEVDITTLLH